MSSPPSPHPPAPGNSSGVLRASRQFGHLASQVARLAGVLDQRLAMFRY